MTKRCTICDRSDAQVIADARVLGLLQEFQCGVYTCCQISEWADEQWVAWTKAARQDASESEELDRRRLIDSAAEPALVPIRLRRPQVPWYRSSDE